MMVDHRSALAEYLTQTDEALSRTVSTKTVAIDTSRAKRAPLLRGDELAQAIRINREAVLNYIAWKGQQKPSQSMEMFVSLSTIAELASINVLPDGLFRKWRYSGTSDLTFSGAEMIPPERVADALFLFSNELFQNLQGDRTVGELLRIVGAAEWDIAVGPLHPFYDACGRIRDTSRLCFACGFHCRSCGGETGLGTLVQRPKGVPILRFSLSKPVFDIFSKLAVDYFPISIYS